MRGYIRFFLRRHFLVNVITAAVIIVGITIALRAQREGFPAVDLDTVIVTARLPGASAEDVESKVVRPGWVRSVDTGLWSVVIQSQLWDIDQVA